MAENLPEETRPPLSMYQCRVDPVEDAGLADQSHASCNFGRGADTRAIVDLQTIRSAPDHPCIRSRCHVRRLSNVIRRCEDRDFELIWAIINDGAHAYKGVIPEDRWTEPYLSKSQLQHEIDEGVAFWGYEENGTLQGVMGIQQVQDATLIRHAYVRTNSQKRGIGAHLLSYLRELAQGPVLIGTWADAVWAIRFYEKNGFQIVSSEQKGRLLTRYWTVSERQIATSVVLADPGWRELNVEE